MSALSLWQEGSPIRTAASRMLSICWAETGGMIPVGSVSCNPLMCPPFLLRWQTRLSAITIVVSRRDREPPDRQDACHAGRLRGGAVGDVVGLGLHGRRRGRADHEYRD